MDPNETLVQLRELDKEVLKSAENGEEQSFEARELAAKFEDLDEWIKSKGFLPKDWSEK